MPGSKNPISKNDIGKKGKALDSTVPEQALDFDITTALSAPVNAHAQDPVAAHKATAISVEDPDNYYAINNVEETTQQLGDTLNTETQGVLVDCSFSSTGLDLTLTTGSTVKIKGQQNSVSDQTVALSASTTQWVYIDATTKQVTKSTTLPTLSAGHVLLWSVTTNGSAVTSSSDYRYFVFNSNRKDSIVVRYASTSSGSYDERSEANFLSLAAAFNYLSTRVTEGSEVKSEIVIRGTHVIPSALTIPQNNITLRGDGHCVLRTGASMVMFNLGAKDRVSFKDITFQCEHTSSTAIQDTAGASDDLRIEDCLFTGVTNLWATCINLQTTAAACQRPKIVNTYFNPGTTGISVSRPRHVLIQGCNFEDNASATTAISIGVSGTAITAGESVSIVSNCSIQGFSTYGVYIKGDGNKIHDVHYIGTGASGSGYGFYIADGDRNTLSSVASKDVFIGIYTDTAANETQIIGATVYGFGTGGSSGGIRILTPKTVLTGCTIDSGETGGLAIRVEANYCVISNCLITNTTTVWSGQFPGGVLIYGTGTKIVGCTIQGFHNTTDSTGYGIHIDNGPDDVDITDCTILGCYAGITNNLAYTYSGVSIKGCTFKSNIDYGIDVYYVSFLGISDCRFHGTAATNAINISYGNDITVSGNQISGEGATQIGIKILGSDTSTQRVYRAVVSNNSVYKCTIQSIYIGTFVRDLSVVGNVIDGYLGSTSDSTAQGIYLDRVQAVQVSGNVIWRCINGITIFGSDSSGLVENVNVVGNTIHHCAVATAPSESFDTEGAKGIGINWGLNVCVRDNDIYSIGSLISDSKVTYQPSGANVYSFGVYLSNSEFCTISDNRIHTLTVKGTGTSRGIAFDHWNVSSSYTFDNNKVVNNSINSANIGILCNVTVGTGTPQTSVATGYDISGNTVSNTTSYGIYVYVDSTSAYASAFTQGSINSNRIDSPGNHAILCQAANYGSLYDITVKGNDITTTVNLDGIHINSLASTTITYGRFYIENNTLKAANSTTGSGIKIDSTSDSWSIASIVGNNIYDFKYGIRAATTTSGSISDLNIANNHCINMDNIGIWIFAITSYDRISLIGNSVTGKSSSCTNLIKVYTTGTGTSTIISNNILRYCSGSQIHILVSRIETLNIVGNNITSDGTLTNEIGILLESSNNSVNIKGARIDGNILSTLGAYGIKVATSPYTGEISNLSIENNQLISVGTGSDSWSSIYLSSPSTQIKDLVISSNQIKDSNTSGCVDGAIRIVCSGTNSDLPRWRIQNNVIRNCYGNGIYISTTDVTYFDHGRITGNVIDLVTENGIYVVLADASAVSSRVGRITHHVCMSNQISDATKDGIYYNLNDIDTVKAISFSNNQCYENDDNGIHISPPYGDGTNIKNASDVMLTGNICEENGDHGIYYESHDVAKRHTTRLLTVSNNMSNNNGKSGIFVYFSSSSGFLNDLSITGNTCYDNGSAARDCGIYVVNTGLTSKNFILSNNILSSNYDVGFRIYTGVADQEDGGGAEIGAVAGSLESITWIGNMARNNATGAGVEDVSSGGTSWPPTYGVNVGNVDSGSTSGQWVDHDGASWSIANNLSIT